MFKNYIRAVKNLKLIIVTLSMLSIGACGKPIAEQYNATQVEGAQFARSLQINDLTGKVRSLNDFNGKVSMVIFGYTQCPDICPTALSRAAKVIELLGAERDKFQVIFVTLDPERDSASLLKEYLANFDKSIIGLLASKEQLKLTTDEFKMFYAKVPGTKADNYSIDHGTMNYIYGKDGKLRLLANHDLTAALLAADIKKLIAQ